MWHGVLAITVGIFFGGIGIFLSAIIEFYTRKYRKQTVIKRERIHLETFHPTNNNGRSYVIIYKMHNYPIPATFQIEMVWGKTSYTYYESNLRAALEKAAQLLDELEIYQIPRIEDVL